MPDTNHRDEAQRLALALGQGLLEALTRAANDGSLARLAAILAPATPIHGARAHAATPSRGHPTITTAPTLAPVDEDAPASLLPPLPAPVMGSTSLSVMPAENPTSEQPVLTELTKRFALIRALPSADGEEQHLAQDVFTGTDALVHVYPLAAGQDEVFCRRLRENGERLRRLEHAHLERIIAVGDHHGRPFVARGVVRGKRVCDLLVDGVAMSEVDVLRLVEQASQGMHAASVAAGTTHGSLAPSCLLVEYAGIAVGMGLGDIESVRVSGFLDPRSARLSPNHGDAEGLAYAAPEVVAGAQGDERSDIYALGAITCRLLTGSPVADVNTLATAVSEVTRNLIMTAMAPRPEMRFLNHNGFCVACVKALRQLAGETPRSMRVLRKPMRLRARTRTEGEGDTAAAVAEASGDTSTRLRRTLLRAGREPGITKEQARTPLPDDDVWTKDVSTRILRKHRDLKGTGAFDRAKEAEAAARTPSGSRPPTLALERRPVSAAILSQRKPESAAIARTGAGTARIEQLPVRSKPVIVHQERDRSIELLLVAVALLLLVLIYN
ncbi:MAG: hypothetical protein H0W72_13810 [Planctomycetes bacterium]|nr:hypothetical protein [Planctomycetota bacterium]